MKNFFEETGKKLAAIEQADKKYKETIEKLEQELAFAHADVSAFRNKKLEAMEGEDYYEAVVRQTGLLAELEFEREKKERQLTLLKNQKDGAIKFLYTINEVIAEFNSLTDEYKDQVIHPLKQEILEAKKHYESLIKKLSNAMNYQIRYRGSIQRVGHYVMKCDINGVHPARLGGNLGEEFFINKEHQQEANRLLD